MSTKGYVIRRERERCRTKRVTEKKLSRGREETGLVIDCQDIGDGDIQFSARSTRLFSVVVVVNVKEKVCLICLINQIKSCSLPLTLSHHVRSCLELHSRESQLRTISSDLTRSPAPKLSFSHDPKTKRQVNKLHQSVTHTNNHTRIV